MKRIFITAILSVFLASCASDAKVTNSEKKVSAGAQFIDGLPLELGATTGRTKTVKINGTNINAQTYLFAFEFSPEGDGLLDAGQTLTIRGPNSAPPTAQSGIVLSGSGRTFMEIHIACGSGDYLCNGIRNGTDEYTLTLSNGALNIKNFAVVALYYQ